MFGYMNLSIVLSLLIVLSCASAEKDHCGASVSLHQDYSRGEFNAYYLNITNTGSCAITNTTLQVTVPESARIVSAKNLDLSTGLLSGFNDVEAGETVTIAELTLLSTSSLPVKPIISVKTYECLYCKLRARAVAPTATKKPTATPTKAPTKAPTLSPTIAPTKAPTASPTASPTKAPTAVPPTAAPTVAPTSAPTIPTPTTDPSAKYFYLGMKFLLLTQSMDDIHVILAMQTLNSLGTPFDVFSFDSINPNATLNLVDTDGSGLYYAIVSTQDTFGASDLQMQQLENYSTTFHIKWVILYMYPNQDGASALGWGVSNATLTFASAALQYATGYVQNYQVNITGIYYYPSQVITSSVATGVPAINIQVAGSTNINTVAAFINYNDGRKKLQFYVDQAKWTLHGVTLSSFWVNWVSNGIYAGARRMSFTCQVDDVFMNTAMYDPAVKGPGTKEYYRIVASDLQALSQWQTNKNAILPANSNIITTLAFNGETVTENGGFKVDPLFLKAKQLVNQFEWETHTWDHTLLDDLTYDETIAELFQNLQAASWLFNANLNLTVPDRWSNKSMVTPAISGLYNPDALSAMFDFGIKAVVGDSSLPPLNPVNPYHGLYTTEALNGYDGIYIVPRIDTNIYYDACLPIHITNQYNDRYYSYWGRNLTFEQVMQQDVINFGPLLLAFRHDPFMFHQANLRIFPYMGKNASLISLWMDRMLDNLATYYSLPILSWSHDDLATILQAREARDACGFSGKLQVRADNLAVVAVATSSTGSCNYAITGATASTSSLLSNEVYGPDSTLWISMSPQQNLNIVLSNNIKLGW